MASSYILGGFGPLDEKTSIRSAAVLAVARVVSRGGFVALDKLSLRSVQLEAKTSESSFFRHFENKAALIGSTFKECWRRVNLYLADVTFVPEAIDTDALEALERDFERIAHLFFDGDEDDRAIATCAFFMYRRAAEFGFDDDVSEQARLFETRIASGCRLAAWPNPEQQARRLIELLIAYWIIWNMNRDDDTLCSPKPFLERLHEDLCRSVEDAPVAMREDGPEVDLAAEDAQEIDLVSRRGR